MIAIGMSAFAATNIDDIFVLMMFLSSLTFPVRQIILGQYIGIGLLVTISALGSFIPLVIPTYIIGLLGIAPIIIGIKLVTFRKKNEFNSKSKETAQDKKKNNLTFAAVAVTFSNGGDNIGVYTPLFAKYNTASPNYYASNNFHGNDCCMVCSSILSCKSPFSCFEDTSYWTHHFALCPHWTWNIHSD
jgi:cadmium resistance protein CadD (predicted permease)